jgi:hypothetical protein
MPKTAIDYSKTIIYKLVHKEDYDNANIYIGSTTDFIRRKNNHKNNCNNEKKREHNDKKYQYIRDNGGWGEWNMIEVENHNCNDGNESRAREEYWWSHFNAQLNSIRAYITDIERLEREKKYRGDNKDKISEQKKQYYDNNKKKILEQQKKHYYNKKNNITDSSSDDSTECI